MRSISKRLFILYCLIIMILVTAIPTVSIFYYGYYQNTKNYAMVKGIYDNVSHSILNKNKLNTIDKDLELGSLFLIILENNQLVFTNESSFKTSKILKTLGFDKNNINKSKEQLQSFFKEDIENTVLSKESFYDKEEFLFKFNLLEIDSNLIEFYVGIDESLIENSFEDVFGDNFYRNLFIFNSVIVSVLIGLGYLLLKSAFYPAKNILKDIKNIQSDKDLSLRINNNYENIEFSKLADNFNLMLENIEQDVFKIRELSVTDSLTKLFNRRHFDNKFKEEFNRCKRTKTNFILAIFDVDMFKQYNDYYGHQKGDEALISISETVQRKASRSNDFIFRVGGEEFSIITSGMSSDEVVLFFNRIRVAIEEEHIEHYHNLASDYLTVSIGVYIIDFSQNDNDFTDTNILENIYKHTDKLLYQAKENKRNNVVMDISS